MRNMLALTAALAIILLGVGYYLGWYRVQSTTTDDGHRHISIDVNTKQIKTDVGNKIRDLTESKEGATPPGPTTPATPAKTVPATTTGFQREDGAYIYPGETFTPLPPGSGPRLPAPR